MTGRLYPYIGIWRDRGSAKNLIVLFTLPRTGEVLAVEVSPRHKVGDYLDTWDEPGFEVIIRG